MKMKHADIQWEQPAPKGHGFSLFLWVMVLLFSGTLLVLMAATILLPKENMRRLKAPEGMKLVGVDTVMQAISVLF